ncbi:MAG: permease [Candidatus Omnitrophica bacterium]|nr:permease [Candidatus Omnitrophota bacterium]
MLQVAVDRLTYSLLGFNPASRLAQAFNFFIYDSVKILALLFVLIAVIGFFRSFLPARVVKAWLVRGRGVANFLASAFGAVTPFCSCSSIPIFLSFLEAGVPLGVSFSFLITSPLINEYLVILMVSFFGWKITAAYVASGLLMGTILGIILGKMNLEKYLVADIAEYAHANIRERDYRGFSARAIFGLNEAISIVKKLWLWVLAGVALGAFIHNYVPQDAIQAIIAKTGLFSVPIATLLGVPMYASCAAIVPVAVVLFSKGVPLGTALSFMMATAALSLPEAVMLRRAMKLTLIAIFFGVTTLAIILTGYLFNFLQHILS